MTLPTESAAASSIRCSSCGKGVSSAVPRGTVVRAWVQCPECLEREQQWKCDLCGGKHDDAMRSAENALAGYRRFAFPAATLKILSPRLPRAAANRADASGSYGSRRNRRGQPPLRVAHAAGQATAHSRPVVTPPIESAASCPRCHRNYEFVTSGPLGIGGIVKALHPPGPCVPPVYEPDEPDEYRPHSGRGGNSPVILHRVCAWKLCRARFKTYAPARKCCSDDCTKARRRQLNRAANLRYWRTKRKREAEALQVEVRAYQRRQGSRRAAA